MARRPLAACRAVVFASLIPDPDDPECPASFRTLVNDLLPAPPNHRQDAGATPDTPRNRCLEFIKHLVRWENSNNSRFIDPARKLIAAAHKFLHPDSKEAMPKVLDPFAGGGAIPLEALRLGCEAHAIDLNPVAHLIELCTLVYPQKYGQPNSRPTPDYIKKLQAAHEGKDGDGLFSKKDGKGKASGAAEIDGMALTRLPLITEAEYQKNPLAADVKFWGHWVLEKARDEIGQFYPPDPDGSIPVAYLWARTVKCPNPACGATIPLIQQSWLCKKASRSVATRIVPDISAKRCRFEVAGSTSINFDPDSGTMQRGKVACPLCDQVADGEYLRHEAKSGRMGRQMMAVVSANTSGSGKCYRVATDNDEALHHEAEQELLQQTQQLGADIVPHEPITPDRPSPNSRGLSAVSRYGLDTFGGLFNQRQLLALTTLGSNVRRVRGRLGNADEGYATGVMAFLGAAFDWFADKSSAFTRWHNSGEKISGTFARQALPMLWDYAEVNPTSEGSGDFLSGLDWILRVIQHTSTVTTPCVVQRSSATGLADADSSIHAVVTDPPYYDAVPYSDLSDFFYVWLKRTLGDVYPDLFRTPLTPKTQELIAYYGSGERKIQKTPKWYEDGMGKAFSEIHRTLRDDGVCCVMFAHKTTTAWESAIAALVRSGLAVTSSWPLHTEMKTRMVAHDAAALASSVTLVCRKRMATAGEGYWDDVRDELREVARERLDFFWQQGIRGADFFISAIGPALSVYGRYAKVTRLTGEEVSVGQFLDEVRGVVTDYALSQILHGAKTGQIDSETRFYVLWKWSYADAKVAADEAFKLAQALGIGTESMWDRTGVLEKQGQNVQALTVAKRMRINDLGEPNVDGRPPADRRAAPLLCLPRQGRHGRAFQYLARSGHGRNEGLDGRAGHKRVLPDGDKEKLLQGLLNQRDKVEEDMKEGRLF